MSTPASDAYAAELAAQMAGTVDLVEGFRDVARSFRSEEANSRSAAETKAATIQTRRDLIDAVQKAIAALNADGYPELPPLELPADLFAVFEAQKRTLNTALAATIPRPEASHATISGLDSGVPRPE